jgi:hypothetical protein
LPNTAFGFNGISYADKAIETKQNKMNRNDFIADNLVVLIPKDNHNNLNKKT